MTFGPLIISRKSSDDFSASVDLEVSRVDVKVCTHGFSSLKDYTFY